MVSSVAAERRRWAASSAGVAFYLQNVHGIKPVNAGLHLLPLTGMMIVGSPLAGAVIPKLGPRVPLAGGMAATAIAISLLARGSSA